MGADATTGDTRDDSVAGPPDWAPKSSRSKRRLLAAVAAVAAIGLVLVFARLASPDGGRLSTVKAERGTVERRLLLEGRAKPDKTYALSFPVPASDDDVGPMIEEMPVKTGDRVGSGQILARLEGDRVESALIRSPADGVVVEARGAAGAPPPAGAVVVVRTLELVAEFDLSEANLSELAEGMEATLTVPVLSRSLPAVVGPLPQDPKTAASLGSAEGAASQVASDQALDYALRIPLPHIDGVRPGMTVVLDVLAGRKTGVLVIPQESIRYDEEGTYVEVLREREVEPVRILTGLSDETSIEVVGGLQGGEEVVVRVERES